MQREVNEKPIYAIAAAVQLPNVSDIEFEASLSELRELAKTLGFTVVRTFIQKRNGFDTTAYLGVGKRQEIHHYVNHEAECEIEAILVDHEISPSQARNLEKEVGCEVMDRTMVILEIFHRNARSRAARAQVEIARLGYMAPRLREAAKLAGPQGRQRSGVGGRGAGESATEMDRRKIRDRIAELQLEIVAMEAERKTQRARRQERQGLASVALVGYTNAGKSTLMRASPAARCWSPTSCSPRSTPPCACCTRKACPACWSAIRWASSRTCRTAWSPRSSRRSTRRWMRRCCSTSSTPATPASSASWR
jgi:GTP-binding protein HflX